LSDALPCIHIVDDDPSVCRALKRLLNSWGMEVRSFSSGAEFLSALSGAHDADCSIIDVQMPEMTGLEVQERMNRAGMDVPIIFITAHEDERVKEQAFKAGAAGFLSKPFTDADLVDLIRHALEGRKKLDAPGATFKHYP
jgi:FixJ family two-component response regulator